MHFQDFLGFCGVSFRQGGRSGGEARILGRRACSTSVGSTSLGSAPERQELIA